MPTATARRIAAHKAHSAPTSTAVFESLLKDIVTGKYGPGARLPSERDLSKALGASRPTLREALRRLGGWGLIEVRRGSGVAVRPRRDWTLDVLPAYLRFGAAIDGPQVLAGSLRDVLAVRRALFVEVLRIVGPRLHGKNALAAAREHVAAAWRARADVGEFVGRDYEALRAIVEAANFLPALWLLSGLAGIYGQIARMLTGASPAPADYPETYGKVFDHLDAGRSDDACAVLANYLDRHDQKMLTVLGVNK
jgi:DNA-binding FadR family transcriptional regulator